MRTPTLVAMLLLATLGGLTRPAAAKQILSTSGPIDRPTAWTVYWCASENIFPQMLAIPWTQDFIADGPEATLEFRARMFNSLTSSHLRQRIDNVVVTEKTIHDANMAALPQDYFCGGEAFQYYNVPPQDLVFLDTMTGGFDPDWVVDPECVYIDSSNPWAYPNPSAPLVYTSPPDWNTGGALMFGYPGSGGNEATASIKIDGLTVGTEYTLSFWWRGNSEGDPGDPIFGDLWVDVFGTDFWVDDTDPIMLGSGDTMGAAWGDFNDDGDQDLFLANFGSVNQLLKNTATVFSDATPAVMNVSASSMGCAWADHDNDGLLDIYVTALSGKNYFYRQRAPGVFEERYSLVEADPLYERVDSYGCAWADVNNDGFVDLSVANDGDPLRWFKNFGGTDFLPQVLIATGSGRSLEWSDFDLNGDLEPYVAMAGSGNVLLRNTAGALSEATPANLGLVGQYTDGAWADYDNDGDFDIYLCSLDNPNRLFSNDGGGVFSNVPIPAIQMTESSSAALWLDYDNDADLDLYVLTDVSPEPNFMFRNDGSNVFTSLQGDDKLNMEGQSVSGATADYDNDGDEDIFIARPGDGNVLLRNDTPNQGHWLQIQMVGAPSNAAAIGARIVLTAGGITQTRMVTSGGNAYLSQSSLIAHFGLGSATLVDSIELHWPSGQTEQIVNTAADQRLRLTEGAVPAPANPILRTDALRQNVPNPFNPSTTLRFELAETAHVELRVFDSAGRLVRVLVDREMAAGEHLAAWDGRNGHGVTAASGVYHAVLKTNAGQQSVRMLLLK